MVCGRRIQGNGWVCLRCEAAYPVLAQPYKDWPEWARIMREEERIRRRRARYEPLVITASDVEAVDRLLYGD